MICNVCGGNSFTHGKILWDALVIEWGINEFVWEYINRQQGSRCDECGCNFRSLALAKAVMRHWSFQRTFQNFVKKYRALKILEINEASDLTKWLKDMPNRVLAEYPAIDMQKMPYADDSFDLVIHSDTLEHIENPVVALTECRRVLRNGGLLAYTVPVIVDRVTRSRNGLQKSYHGFPDTGSDDYLVHTEYGADMWQQVMQAGFDNVRMDTFDYPAGIAISASDGNGPMKRPLLQRLFRRV